MTDTNNAQTNNPTDAIQAECKRAVSLIKTSETSRRNAQQVFALSILRVYEYQPELSIRIDKEDVLMPYDNLADLPNNELTPKIKRAIREFLIGPAPQNDDDDAANKRAAVKAFNDAFDFAIVVADHARAFNVPATSYWRDTDTDGNKLNKPVFVLPATAFIPEKDFAQIASKSGESVDTVADKLALQLEPLTGSNICYTYKGEHGQQRAVFTRHCASVANAKRVLNAAKQRSANERGGKLNKAKLSELVERASGMFAGASDDFKLDDKLREVLEPLLANVYDRDPAFYAAIIESVDAHETVAEHNERRSA